MPAAASAAVIVVGLTVKYELLDDTVRLPVKFVALIVNVLEAVLPLTTEPNAKDVGFTVMLGGLTHVPVAVTFALAAPPPLMVMVLECEPAAVGL